MTKLKLIGGALVIVALLVGFGQHPAPPGATTGSFTSPPRGHKESYGRPDRDYPSFLVISDIHLHREYDQSPAVTGNSDSGKDLWDSAENKIRSVLSGRAAVSRPKFILYLGDLPWHGKDSAQLPDVMENAGQVLGDLRRLAENADVPLIYVPGNNDSDDGDYAPFSTHIFQRDNQGRNAWPVIDGAHDQLPADNPCLGDTSAWRLGCYSAYPLKKQAGLTLVVLVLNTNIFTARYARMAGRQRQTTDADKVLEWFRRQLGTAAAQHQHVLIAMHVPPGKDGYLPAQSNRETCTGKFKDLWDPSLQVQSPRMPSPGMPTQQIPPPQAQGLGQTGSAQDAFLDLVNAYKRSIVGIVTSHTHMDGIRVLRDRNEDSVSALLISVPGIAPGHGNNPGIKLISYDPVQFQLQDFVTLYEDFYPDRTVKPWGDLSFSFRNVFQAAPGGQQARAGQQGSIGAGSMPDGVQAGSMLDLVKALPSDSLRKYTNSIYTVYNGDGYGKGNCVDTTLYVHYQQ